MIVNFVVQSVSLLGAVFILVAYIANQRGLVSSKADSYLVANLMGAILLTVVAVWDRRIGFLLLEGIWALVSLWSLAQKRRKPIARMDRV